MAVAKRPTAVFALIAALAATEGFELEVPPEFEELLLLLLLALEPTTPPTTAAAMTTMATGIPNLIHLLKGFLGC